MEKSKVVILAVGSFNPPTFGHLRMLENAKNSLELSGKEVVEGILSPVSIMYGKSTLIGSNHRLAMTEAATTTLNVLKHHQQEVKIRLGPDVEVLLLVGGDVVVTFDKYNADGSLVWNLEDVQEIVSIGLVVQPRPGSDPEETLKNLDFLGWTQNVYVIKNVIASNVISSTSLRAAIKEHRSIKYTTPDEVITYIKEHNLYE
ncbi:hypothetical protein L3Y34_010497 [Caenorhabditis briggsae]|uniref:Cytidyltransferase-like domain-containing protein n=1 Tax=Caenorhabditis briggsae TaxID=6238 RepID=A0AAE8ZLM7_CAEBR|nr:hypothetical protein L3Y34_010497 [Caenorhabditis briggsae]